MQRLERVLLDHKHAPMADIVAALEAAIRDCTGFTAQFDNIALVIARRTRL
jgi:hypothetical protein